MENDIAQALGLELRHLRYFATHRLADRVSHYVYFTIPKASGGERLIAAPKRYLKEIQRRLLVEVVRRLPMSESAHGFRRGRSTRTHAAAHRGKAVVIRLDLQDFFGHLTFPRVRGLLMSVGYGFEAAAVLALLMTEAERQPVELPDGKICYTPVGPRHCLPGAPTSPGLGNAIARRLDRRLAGLARRFELSYTRYADDLTFSSHSYATIGVLLHRVGNIVEDEGFVLNRSKTRIMRRGGAQVVTGVTVNQVLGLSRRERRRIRARIHHLRRARQAGTLEPAQIARLRGKLAYVHMLNPAQAQALRNLAGDLLGTTT